MSEIIPVADFADMVHPISAKWKSLAMIQVYIDESGTHSNAPVCIMAGYIGHKDSWVKFETEWLKLLSEFNDDNIRFFHMAEIVNRTRQFELINRDKANYLITQASNILKNMSSSIVPIFSGVIVDDWNIAVQDSIFLNRFPKPIFLCFDDIMRQIWEWRNRFAPKESISLVFAEGVETENKWGLIEELIKKEDWYKSFRGSVSFSNMERIVPLQGADFLSYLMYQSIINREFITSNGSSGCSWSERINDEPYALVNSSPRGKFGHYFDEDALRMTIKRYSETGEIYQL